MAEKNIVPNLEAKASDGRKHGVYTETVVGTIPAVHETGTQNRYYTTNKRRRCNRIRMAQKRKSYPRRLHLGSRTGSFVPNNAGRIQNRTGQHQNQRLNPGVHRVILTKTQYLPQPGRFLLGQTNGRRITRRILEKTNRNPKRM